MRSRAARRAGSAVGQPLPLTAIGVSSRPPGGSQRTRMRGCSRTRKTHWKEVCGIDIETCPACVGWVRIIVSIGDPEVIAKTLEHRKTKMAPKPLIRFPAARIRALFGVSTSHKSWQCGARRYAERGAGCPSRSGERARCLGASSFQARWFLSLAQTGGCRDLSAGDICAQKVWDRITCQRGTPVSELRYDRHH